jgi:hypothetical protein
MIKRFNANMKSYEFRAVMVGFITIAICVLDFVVGIIAIHYDCTNLLDILSISFIVHIVSGSAWLNTEEWNDIDKCIQRDH